MNPYPSLWVRPSCCCGSGLRFQSRTPPTGYHGDGHAFLPPPPWASGATGQGSWGGGGLVGAAPPRTERTPWGPWGLGSQLAHAAPWPVTQGISPPCPETVFAHHPEGFWVGVRGHTGTDLPVQTGLDGGAPSHQPQCPHPCLLSQPGPLLNDCRAWLSRRGLGLHPFTKINSHGGCWPGGTLAWLSVLSCRTSEF